MLAIVAGGVAGAMCLVGGLLLLHRRVFDARIRATSSFGDTAILALLLAQLCLGLATIPISLEHRDGGEMIKFMYWAQGIFTFRAGAADYVADAHWIFKAHLTLGLTILLVFPFTRLVHMLSAPIWYLNRRGWQIVRSKRLAAGQAHDETHPYPELSPRTRRNEAFSGCSHGPVPAARRAAKCAADLRERRLRSRRARSPRKRKTTTPPRPGSARGRGAGAGHSRSFAAPRATR